MRVEQTALTFIRTIVDEFASMIAAMATKGGGRLSLEGLDNHFQQALIRSLVDQQLNHKVIADMLGMSLSSFGRHLARARNLDHDQNDSQWSKLYAFISAHPNTSRDDILKRFYPVEEVLIAGLLRDMVSNELVTIDRNDGTWRYRVIDGADFERLVANETARQANFVWVAIHRYGPLSQAQLAAKLAVTETQLDRALATLTATGRVDIIDDDTPTPLLAVTNYNITQADASWESAVYDHLHAVFKTVTERLKADTTTHLHASGSTYSFDIWENHPANTQLFNLVNDFRKKTSELWDDLVRHNREHIDGDDPHQLTLYFGEICLPK